MTIDLNIAGLDPFSTCDWPGNIVATIFLQGCPWDCEFCFNWKLIDPKIQGGLSWDDVEKVLVKRQDFLDGVVLSGGEPLLQADATKALRRIRELGFKVGLHTEGAFHNRLVGALTLIDWVGYDIKAMPEDYRKVIRTADAGELAWRGLDRILESGVDYEIRTTVSPGSPQEERWEEIVDSLRVKGVRTYALQKALPEGARPFKHDAPGWDDRLLEMKAYAESAGFDKFIFRG